MDDAHRAMLQVRLVKATYRSELARLSAARIPQRARQETVERLRARCMSLLHDARAVLDGSAPWHPEVLAALDAAAEEIREPPRGMTG